MDGPMPVCLAEIKAYLDLTGPHHEDDVALFIRVIPELDDCWLKSRYESAKIEREKADKTRKRG